MSQRDTKRHYIPHTRTRGYLVAFLLPDAKKNEKWPMPKDLGLERETETETETERQRETEREMENDDFLFFSQGGDGLGG